MYGQALLRRSRAAFDELKQGIKDIAFLSDPTSGELRIACGIALAASILPPIIDSFSKAYPRVVMHVQEPPPPTRWQHISCRLRCQENLIHINAAIDPVLTGVRAHILTVAA
jgi:DNA-binding transcriptional LysR family regulator